MSMLWVPNPPTQQGMEDDDDDEDNEGSFIVLNHSSGMLEAADSEMSFTTEEITLIRNENETLKENIMKNTELLRRQLDIMQSWKEEKEKMVKAYHTSHEELRQLCGQHKEQNESQSKEIQELRTKVQAYQEQLAKMEEAQKQMVEERLRLTDQIAQAQQRATEAAKQLEEERLALKNEIAQCVVQAEKRADECSRQLAELKTEAERKQLEWKMEVETLEAEKVQMGCRLDQAEARLREFLVVDETESFAVVHHLPTEAGRARSSLPEGGQPKESSLQACASGSGCPQKSDEKASVEVVANSEDISKLQEEVRTLHNLLALEREKRTEDSHQLEESRAEMQRVQQAFDDLRLILGPAETNTECVSQQSEALQDIVSRTHQENMDQLMARCLHAEQLVESRRDPESRMSQLEDQLAELPTLKEQLETLQAQLEEERSKREAAEKDNTDLQDVISTIFDESSSHPSHPSEWEQVSSEDLAAAAAADRDSTHFSGRARLGRKFGKYKLYRL